MNTTVLRIHLLGLRDTTLRRLRDEDRGDGDPVASLVIFLGMVVMAIVVVAVITFAVHERAAQPR